MSRLMKFGMLLGGTLGLMSTTIDVRMLRLMGNPDVLIRPGWELPAVIIMVGLGSIVGLTYADFVRRGACLESVRKRELAIFLSTLAAAAGIYVLADYISIKMLDCLPWFLAQLAVYVVAIAIARVLARPSRNDPQSAITDKP